jgi:hypothetical protein
MQPASAVCESASLRPAPARTALGLTASDARVMYQEPHNRAVTFNGSSRGIGFDWKGEPAEIAQRLECVHQGHAGERETFLSAVNVAVKIP